MIYEIFLEITKYRKMTKNHEKITKKSGNLLKMTKAGNEILTKLKYFYNQLLRIANQLYIS